MTDRGEGMSEVERVWNEFWKPIVCKNETLDIEQIKKELCDYLFLLEQVPKVYNHITNGLLSKPNYYADAVIAAADDVCTKTVEEEMKELKTELADYKNAFGCITCGELHVGDCPPHEVRTSGKEWFSTTQAINRYNSMEAELAQVKKERKEITDYITKMLPFMDNIPYLPERITHIVCGCRNGLELQSKLEVAEKNMKVVEKYLKPNMSNDMNWSDEIIIAIDNKVETELFKISEGKDFSCDTCMYNIRISPKQECDAFDCLEAKITFLMSKLAKKEKEIKELANALTVYDHLPVDC